MPQPTYAQLLGAHRANRDEVKQAVERGELKSANTRAYVLPSGRVVSNRALQQMGMQVRYGVETLEQRAVLRYEAFNVRSDYSTMAHFIRSLQKRDPSFKGMSFHQVRTSDKFQTIWGDWKAVKHRSPRQRLAFLRAYKLVVREKGTWQT